MIATQLIMLGLGLGLGQTAAGSAADHPTLATNWIATTWQPGTPAPSGDEAYRFIDKPTDANPSTLWSNYSQADCKRLIKSGGYEDQTRYYLKCFAADCCKCDQKDAGNQIEFQIPNVHPNWLAPITHSTGACDFPESGQPTIPDADLWAWKFGPAAYTAFTRQCATCNNTGGQAGPGTELLKWQIHIAAENITIEYQNYTIPDDTEQFKDSFNVPMSCQGNIVTCCQNEKATPMGRLAGFMARHNLPGNETSWKQ